MTPAGAGGTVPPMEQLVASGSLRQRPSDYIARAARGETFIVLRRALSRARRAPVLITWRNAVTAVLGPLPAEWRWEPER